LVFWIISREIRVIQSQTRAVGQKIVLAIKTALLTQDRLQLALQNAMAGQP
jgi:hypothetical protein